MADLRLSPSAINTYFRCPRLFYYNYILKKRTPPNIHLYKGTFVHRVLENVFRSTKYINIKEYSTKQMEKWKPNSKLLEGQDAELHKKEAETMLETFSDKVDRKIDMLLMEKKANSKNHAWNLIKPKLKEYKIYDKTLNVVGIIDNVEESFNKMVYLIDYKTSKLYRHTLPDEYVRQLSIYAYLYKTEFGRLPNYVGIDYLRYGETFIVPVSDALVAQAISDIKEVKEKTKSRNIEDYPRCTQKWCDCNVFEKEKE